MKTVIISLITASVPFIMSFITTLKTIELTFNLPTVISVIAFVIILLLVIVQISKRSRDLKKKNYELLHPENPNINKFKIGDIVIRKIEAENLEPEKLSVVNKKRSEIECRKMDGQMIKLAPEELLSDTETEEVFKKIKENRAATAKLLSQMNRRRQISRGIDF